MPQVEISRCSNCSRAFEVVDCLVTPVMEFHCRCGKHQSVTVPPELVQQAGQRYSELEQNAPTNLERSMDLVVRLLMILLIAAGVAGAWAAWKLLGVGGLLMGVTVGFGVGFVTALGITLAVSDLAVASRYGLSPAVTPGTHEKVGWLLGFYGALTAFTLVLTFCTFVDGILFWVLLAISAVVGFVVVRAAFRTVVPASCRRCGDRAYDTGRLKLPSPSENERSQRRNHRQFICVNCGLNTSTADDSISPIPPPR